MRFYGGTLSEWRATPAYIVLDFIRQLDQIQAEEQLSMMGTVAAGTGSMKKHDLSEFRRNIERRANPPERRRARRQRAAPSTLATLGIGYHQHG